MGLMFCLPRRFAPGGGSCGCWISGTRVPSWGECGVDAAPRSAHQQDQPLAPVEVFLDLNFNERAGRSFSCTSSNGPSRGKGPVLQALRMAEGPFQRGRQVLAAVQLDCIPEVEVNCTWDLPTLGTFALYLGQVRNLQRLSLSHIHMLSEEDEEQEDEEEEQEEEEEEERDREQQEEQRSFSQFLSQMLNLPHLRELDTDSPSFLQGRLDQVLRCLQTPLDKLSITNCWQLSHSGLPHLFQCPNLRQLKSLHLFGLSLVDFHPEPLGALLEAVAPTLRDLGLDNCAMVDSQVETILPVLSRCHQLREFTISENNFSVATVGKLLCHTAGLRSLEHELYPAPLECYRTQGGLSPKGDLPWSGLS